MASLFFFQMANLGLDEMINKHNLLYSSFLIIFISILYLKWNPRRPIYLVNYSCYKPSYTCRFPSSTFIEHIRAMTEYNPQSIEFQERILERSGLGQETCLPPSFHYNPIIISMVAAREEAQTIIFSAIDSLFEKTGIKPQDIDILVLNCSLFSPTPSLSAMVVNKYKLRSNIRNYNLSGMGCSAGLLSVNLASELLQVHPNSYALVLSTEIMSHIWYKGNHRSFLVTNCIFRTGGAAILLSNHRRDRWRAKYRLLHLLRTHKGADDKAYSCVVEDEDPDGNIGISLEKELTTIAGEALKANITTLGPLVLPVSEKFLYVVAFIRCKMIKNIKWKVYVPDFKQAFEHFCIHAGGRAVIDELEKKLQLSQEHVEASRMTLHRFGNTSSSSIWYELSYIEGKGRMKGGDRVWQIAFGSGFKCNSAVWVCNRRMMDIQPSIDGPWVDCIDRYPVYIPKVVRV